jgi:hypothetical protein
MDGMDTDEAIGDPDNMSMIRFLRTVWFLSAAWFLGASNVSAARSGDWAAAFDGGFNPSGYTGGVQVSRRLFGTFWINGQVGNGSLSHHLAPRARTYLGTNASGDDYQLNMDILHIVDGYFSWRRPGSARWRVLHNAGIGVSRFRALAHQRVVAEGHPFLFRGDRTFTANGGYLLLGLLRFRHKLSNPYNFQLGFKARAYRMTRPLSVECDDGNGSTFTATWRGGTGPTWVFYPQLFLRFEVLL